MASTAVARAKVKNLPKSATITIKHQDPTPAGEVEVMPEIGRVHFRNKDPREYRIRLWRVNTDPAHGIELSLAPRGKVTIVIHKDDEFNYSVLKKNEPMDDGHGGGPIKN
jgi:hypothetical protein